MNRKKEFGLRKEPGTYALWCVQDQSQTVEVGAAGTLSMTPGVYVYVGSALGPGGLQARVRRHACATKTLHWHIDYLRAVTTLETVLFTYSSKRFECRWADALCSWERTQMVTPGIGASDCDCETHVFKGDAEACASLRNRLAIYTTSSIDCIDAAFLAKP